jgi:CheY-like chemotaxis protein
MNVSTRFIVIDDDEFNNKICSVTLEKIDKDANIKTFLSPVEGFAHIVTEYSRTDHNESAVLFLDINMPVMNGWEFLERFDELDPSIKKRLKIYILSSSVDKRDIEKAKANKNVVHYLIKPLTKETIRLITYSQNR